MVCIAEGHGFDPDDLFEIREAKVETTTTSHPIWPMPPSRIQGLAEARCE